MAKLDTLIRIAGTGILPVVRAGSQEEALAVVDAILAGGIDVIEVTMTVPGAVEVIRALVARYGDRVAVGAGTVLDAETARACMLAGAEFVVSPSLDEATIAICRTYSIPMIAGALTPTEIVRAWRAGASMVKVFPVGAMGGASYLKSLKAPFPQISLVPTGGVTVETAADYVRAGASALGAGGDLVDVKAIRAGEPEKVVEKARRYLEVIRRARSD